MFDNNGKLDARSQRILSEQTIPPRYGYSPGMMTAEQMADQFSRNQLIAEIDSPTIGLSLNFTR